MYEPENVLVVCGCEAKTQMRHSCLLATDHPVASETKHPALEAGDVLMFCLDADKSFMADMIISFRVR